MAKTQIDGDQILAGSVTNTELATGAFTAITGLGIQTQALDMGTNGILDVTTIADPVNVAFDVANRLLYDHAPAVSIDILNRVLKDTSGTTTLLDWSTPGQVTVDGNLIVTTTLSASTILVTTTLSASTILVSDGSASLPSYSFTNDPTTGMYRDTGTNLLDFAFGGNLILSIGNTGAAVQTPGYVKLAVLSGISDSRSQLQLAANTSSIVEFCSQDTNTDYVLLYVQPTPNFSILLPNNTNQYVFGQTTLDVTGHTISNLTDPTSAQDASTKNYVDTFITPVTSGVSAGGVANEELTVTGGLLTTSTIYSVTSVNGGANNVAMTGYINDTDGSLNIFWTADPGAGAQVLVLFKP